MADTGDVQSSVRLRRRKTQKRKAKSIDLLTYSSYLDELTFAKLRGVLGMYFLVTLITTFVLSFYYDDIVYSCKVHKVGAYFFAPNFGILFIAVLKFLLSASIKAMRQRKYYKELR